ncbi:MAG: hypothetical protein GX335_00255 [Firmicutes bacterium]|nr:hypothetical protein [Bacillota bacterium]
MKQESITVREKESTVRIQVSQVNALRIKDITRKAVRVYADHKIGISGAEGESTDAVLLENAVQNLAAGIEYPYDLSRERKDHRTYNHQSLEPEELLQNAEEILAVLRRDYPDFNFSEFISSSEVHYKMKNSEGLDLEYKDAFFLVNLILKEKTTANLFDGALICQSRRFEPDLFWSFNRMFLEACRRKADLPKNRTMPVFTLGTSGILSFLGRALNGRRYAQGSSLFSGKLGTQLYSEKIMIDLNRNPKLKAGPFYDQGWF